jgi:NAD(P)-dependent dehydrogenase (short-subunit alcohol dehydrogenase family)
VQRDEDVERFLDGASERLGPLSAVFANAGISVCGPAWATEERGVRTLMETNFFGTYRVLRAAVPRLESQAGGQVLICSSACSEFPLPMYGFYTASKAAQDGLAGAARAELAGRGIQVTTVHPIGARAELFEMAARRKGDTHIGYAVAQRLLHSPEKVARAVVQGIRRPRPEVWPSPGTRFGTALTSAFPGLAARVARRMVQKHFGAEIFPEDAGRPPERTLQEPVPPYAPVPADGPDWDRGSGEGAPAEEKGIHGPTE